MLPTISDDDLAKMPHWLLYAARQYVPREQQARLAGFEHQAFGREFTAQYPYLAPVSAVGAIGYQPYKMLRGDTRSPPSLEQMGQGLKGIYQGLTNPPPPVDANQWYSSGAKAPKPI
jgi:hypothetical protein